ncbi:predicted protein [Sclerotinia sclerotiorum 1980 UF-70]|uniref:Uncharacterized protein n=1 Tax=Sclerotinia sclerotiorum (strain ATCC 18683 / 1980 / Ss-1) TaxID=665079 RepID=A7EUW1_SCLS1|nr:predicted protein [Sclerotinia sclerotiorum 1980 UF-70]EDN93253.1 predicted protein [Sclerotinia sclerotiorum 1980 UF-70]
MCNVTVKIFKKCKSPVYTSPDKYESNCRGLYPVKTRFVEYMLSHVQKLDNLLQINRITPDMSGA